MRIEIILRTMRTMRIEIILCVKGLYCIYAYRDNIMRIETILCVKGVYCIYAYRDNIMRI